jgi:hypothetical protein
MAEDLRTRVKELKKRLDEGEHVLEISLEKFGKDLQKAKFDNYMSGLSNEMKKSSEEGKYLDSMKNGFEGLSVTEIRYAIEKSHDRYESLLTLMNKYKDNFESTEYNKYATKFLVLNKILSFMVAEHIGEYEQEGESNGLFSK